ncbi:baseplate J/gp47 family protein [Acidocella sp.]|uniref:baseplate J/gp47 family protein n=1 Tax=Acidocella sp. TaxID=50710 RepID=UPI002602921B|nr:baseplate J/gp47 family protein [Acidocella sp.]
MPMPVPAPGVIAGRAASIYEELLPGIDARSQNTVATANTRITEMAMQDLYVRVQYLAQEMFPDTAQDNLPRFGVMWGVPQVQPSAATGNAVISGGNTVVIPAGVQLASNAGPIYTTQAAVAIGTSLSASVPVEANVPGAAGNLVAGAPLTITSPTGLNINLNAVVDSAGLSGGADIETDAAWQSAIVQEIQTEPAAGDAADYVKWAKEALPNVQLAACPPGACGGGVVSVVIAMTGLVAPTAQQIATVLAYIQGKRPVGAANITVYACVLNPVNVTLHLNPDTVEIRAAAEAALALSFAQDAAIGGTTYKSRLETAIGSSDGEDSDEMSVPAADVPAPTLFSLNVLGTVNFV